MIYFGCCNCRIENGILELPTQYEYEKYLMCVECTERDVLFLEFIKISDFEQESIKEISPMFIYKIEVEKRKVKLPDKFLNYIGNSKEALFCGCMDSFLIIKCTDQNIIFDQETEIEVQKNIERIFE